MKGTMVINAQGVVVMHILRGGFARINRDEKAEVRRIAQEAANITGHARIVSNERIIERFSRKEV